MKLQQRFELVEQCINTSDDGCSSVEHETASRGESGQALGGDPLGQRSSQVAASVAIEAPFFIEQIRRVSDDKVGLALDPRKHIAKYGLRGFKVINGRIYGAKFEGFWVDIGKANLCRVQTSSGAKAARAAARSDIDERDTLFNWDTADRESDESYKSIGIGPEKNGIGFDSGKVRMCKQHVVDRRKSDGCPVTIAGVRQNVCLRQDLEQLRRNCIAVKGPVPTEY